MTNLSPAAQAVLDAAFDPYRTNGTLASVAAAALRAAADQVVPEGFADAYDCCLEIMAEIRDDILAIADELEGAQ